MKFGWICGCAIGAMLVGCAAKPKAATTAPMVLETAAVPAEQVAVTTRPTTQGVVKEVVLQADADGRFVQRTWPLAVAFYPNGGTVAGFTYWQTADQPSNRPAWQDPFFDLGRWAWDTFTSPYHMVVSPPWTSTTYGGGAQQAPVPGSEQDPVQAPARSGR